MIIAEAKKNNYISYLINCFICLPVVVYLKVIYKYALNIPREDDYDCVLQFLCKYKNLSFFDKLTELFKQEAEHRTFLLKAILALHYLLYGDINFRHLIFVCTILLLIIFIVVLYFIRKSLPGNWQVAGLILSLSLFDLNNYENMGFASAGLFNYGVIALFTLSILLYSAKNDKLIIPAAILQILSIYSGGNGMIAAFFIVIYTILNKEKKRKIASLVSFFVFCPLYFYHYSFSHNNSSFFVIDISRNLSLLLNSLGAKFSQYSLIGGVAFLVAMVYLLPVNRKLKITESTLPLLCIAGFGLASLATMSVFRGKLDSVGVAYSPRYFVYSHLFIAIVFVFLFLRVKSARILLASVAFTAVFYLVNFSGALSGFESYYSSEKTTDYRYPTEGKTHAKEVADESCRQGIYCLEKHRND